MDILKRKGIRRALLCIEADRDSHVPANESPYFSGRISKRDMAARLVDIDGGDGGRHLLDQRQPFSRYFSFVLLIRSSNVEPRSPREFQVAMSAPPFKVASGLGSPLSFL